MIEAYKIAVNLVSDQAQVTGPLAAVLRAFQDIQAAQRGAQAGLNEFAAGIRAATNATNRLAEAWRGVTSAAQAAGRAARGTAPSGGGAGSGTASSRPPPVPPSAPAQPLQGNAGAANTNSVLWLPPPVAAAGGPPAPFFGYPRAPGGGALMATTGGGSGGNAGPPPLLGSGGAGMPPLNYPGGLPPALPSGGGGGFNLVHAYNAFHVVERLVEGIAHLTEKAAGFNDALVKLEQRGLDPAATRGIADTAFAISQAVPGRTMEQITHDAGSLRAVLGENDGGDPMAAVKAFLPDVEKTAAALAGTSNISSETALHLLFRAIEMRGGTVDPKTGKISPERFKKELEAVYKVLQTAGGIASERDILNLVQQGSVIAKTMDSPDDFWKMMLAPLTDQKGSRAGTALQAGGRALLGGKMSGETAIELGRILGFDKDAFEADQPGKAGKAALFKLRAELLEKTLADMKDGLQPFIEKDIRPGLIAHGYTTAEQQNAEIFKIAGTDTFRRILSLFLSNADQVLKEGKLYDKVPSVENALKMAGDKSIGFNFTALFASVENFFQELTKTNAQDIIGLTKAVTGFFDRLTAGEHAIDAMHQDAKAPSVNPFSLGPYSPYHIWERGFWHGDGAGPRSSNSDASGRSVGPGSGNDNITAPSAPKLEKQSLILNVDGKRLASIMMDYAADGLARPPLGRAGADVRVSPLMPGLSSAFG